MLGRLPSMPVTSRLYCAVGAVREERGEGACVAAPAPPQAVQGRGWAQAAEVVALAVPVALSVGLAEPSGRFCSVAADPQAVRGACRRG